jgi:TonB family protein
MRALLYALLAVIMVVGVSAFASEPEPFSDLMEVKGVQPTKLVRSQLPPGGHSGHTRVAIAISKDGAVNATKVISSELPTSFDNIVLAAIDQWRFPQQFVNGNPVAYRTTIQLTFNPAPMSLPEAPKFVWDTSEIRAEVMQKGHFCPGDTEKQYIHLTRTDDSKPGWTMINLIVPSEWKVDQVVVKDPGVVIVEANRGSYKLTKDNVEILQHRETEACPITDEHLESWWTELAHISD